MFLGQVKAGRLAPFKFRLRFRMVPTRRLDGSITCQKTKGNADILALPNISNLKEAASRAD